METRAVYGASVSEVRAECLVAHASWVPPTGDEVRAALAMASWSLEEFARRIGVAGRTVRRWVSDEKPITYSAWCVLAVQAGLGQVWNFDGLAKQG